MPRAWEEDLHSWEQDWHTEPQADPDDPDFDYDAVSAKVAAEEFGNLVVDLKLQGSLSAKHACILCWWASKAGIGGITSRLAVHPQRSSGQYSKHFDLVVGSGADAEDDFYVMSTPSFRRTDATRVSQDVRMWPPLEAADEEIMGEPNMQSQLAECIAKGDLPPAYFEHRGVTEAPADTPVYPYSLYVDGVKFQRTDHVIGFYLTSLVTGQRMLVCALRKSELCACGCRGADTIYTVMLTLHWSFAAMIAGLRPESRHDGSAWTRWDSVRDALAGRKLGWRGVIIWLKCDMAEFTTTFGFPSWMTRCPSAAAAVAAAAAAAAADKQSERIR